MAVRIILQDGDSLDLGRGDVLDEDGVGSVCLVNLGAGVCPAVDVFLLI